MVFSFLVLAGMKPTEGPPVELPILLRGDSHSPSSPTVDRILRKTDRVYSGGLNENYVYIGDMGDAYMLRIGKGQEARDRTLLSLQEEYSAIGASKHGIGVKIRTLPEQAAFIDRLHNAGISTIPYFHSSEDAMLLPFVSGIPLHAYIGEGEKTYDELKVVDSALDTIVDAHKKGIVFGDRWATNTMVLPDKSTVELDFDLELTGDYRTTATFELSQMLYHLLHFSGRNRTNMVNRVLDYFENRPDIFQGYNFSQFADFMKGQSDFFWKKWKEEDQFYEGLPPSIIETTFVVFMLSTIRKQSNRPIVAFAA